MEENNLNEDNLSISVDIVKEVNILQDDRQTTIRIPKEIVEFFKIKKGDKFKFKIEIPEDENESPKSTFEVINNGT